MQTVRIFIRKEKFCPLTQGLLQCRLVSTSGSILLARSQKPTRKQLSQRAQRLRLDLSEHRVRLFGGKFCGEQNLPEFSVLAKRVRHPRRLDLHHPQAELPKAAQKAGARNQRQPQM